MAVTPSPTHTHLWFKGADIALWIGWGQRACDKQMFSWIGILGQVGLVKERERGDSQSGCLHLTRGVLTVLHLVNSPASTFRPSMTISPAITALVVAMAGIMLPAMAEGEGRGVRGRREGEGEGRGERGREEGRGGGERGGERREAGGERGHDQETQS